MDPGVVVADPLGSSSVASTSAIRLLRVASQPTKSMPAALRTTLRPPSAPTRYVARSGSALGEVQVDAGLVLGEAGHLQAATDRHPQLLDPAEHDPLDVVLPQPQRVRVPGREVAEVQRRVPEAHRLRDLSLGEEPVGDPALVEDLQRARVEPARAGADQLRCRTSFDDRDIDPRQRQLPGQHHARRPAPDDDHFVHLSPCLFPARPRSLGHRPGPCRKPPVALYLGSGRERAPCLRRSRSPRDTASAD